MYIININVEKFNALTLEYSIKLQSNLKTTLLLTLLI